MGGASIRGSSWALSFGAIVAVGSGCVVEAQVGARPSVARRLGVVTRGSCAVASLVADVGPSCVVLTGDVEVGPALDASAARAAFDGDVCRSWNAASKAPVSIGLSFDAPERVTAVMLIPSDRGEASHVVEASDDGASWRQLVVVRGELAGEQAYAIVLPEPVSTRHLRVTTTGSSVPVTWREIAPLSCGGPASPISDDYEP